MRHVLRTEDDLRNLVYLNDVGHLREVADEAFGGLALRFRTHQTDEIRFNRSAFKDGIHTLRLLGTTDDQKAFLHRPFRLEVLVAQQNSNETCEAHFQSEPYHAEENQSTRKTKTLGQQGIQHQNHGTTKGHTQHGLANVVRLIVTTSKISG